MKVETYEVRFFDPNREPETLEAKSDKEAIDTMCEVFDLEPPLTHSRTKGIENLWLLRKGKAVRRIWP